MPETSIKATTCLRQTHNKYFQENPAITRLLPSVLESPQLWTTPLFPSSRGFMPDLTPALGQDE